MGKKDISNRGLRILGVGEDPLFQLLQQIFEGDKFGILFDLSPNSTEAIRKVESNEYDLLVVDHNLQWVGGEQFLKFVKNRRTKCKFAFKVMLVNEEKRPNDLRSIVLSTLCDKIVSRVSKSPK